MFGAVTAASQDMRITVRISISSRGKDRKETMTYKPANYFWPLLRVSNAFYRIIPYSTATITAELILME